MKDTEHPWPDDLLALKGAYSEAYVRAETYGPYTILPKRQLDRLEADIKTMAEALHAWYDDGWYDAGRCPLCRTDAFGHDDDCIVPRYL
jgi:hypothetical protein